MIGRYLDRIESDLEEYEPEGPCETINFGGGTPTLLSTAQLERLFRAIEKRLKPEKTTEISIEANPETLDREKVQLIRSFANRISLGVQSFRPKFRDTLGRDCCQKALRQAIELIAEAKFPHWNCDLIYAIPGQKGADFRHDLEEAFATGADHVSCYNLTPEEGARLSDRLIPDEEDSVKMWKKAGELAEAAGFHRYEISNYAKKNGECRHNVNVWRGGLLKGFGPAAASFDGKKRSIQPESIRSWLRRSVPEFDEIPLGDRLNEIFIINLRTTNGWTPKLWKSVPEADSWHRRVEAARKAASKTSDSFFEISSHRIRLTEEGMLFWNSVAESII